MKRSRFNIVWILFLLVFAFGTNAHASILSTNFEITPTVPTTDDEIKLTVTVVLPVPCFTVEFSELIGADHTFRALVDITPPAEGTPCIEVLGKFSHTYILGRLPNPVTYRFQLDACERDPIERLCIIHPAEEFKFTVFVPENIILAGFDSYLVDSALTQISFTGEFAIPAGFFDQRSRPFRNSVKLTAPFWHPEMHQPQMHPVAAPLVTIERKETIGFDHTNTSTQTVPIELVLLSLQSTAPLAVRIGNETQLWNLFVELSPTRASIGRMTVTKRTQRGGTFSIDLTVFPLLRFVRQSDGLKRMLDIGALWPLPSTLKKLTLKIRKAPWLHECLGTTHDFDPRFCPGATAQGVQRLRAESLVVSLGIRFVPITILASWTDQLLYSFPAQTDVEVYSRVEVFALSGEKVLSQELADISANAIRLEKSMSQLANGVYLVRVTASDRERHVLSTKLHKSIILK